MQTELAGPADGVRYLWSALRLRRLNLKTSIRLMDIRWLNAVIDLPADSFERAGRFWAEVTNTTWGEIHPKHPEFVHLHPTSGAMHLELQRLDDGPPGVHLDLVVDDIPVATQEAVDAGATVVVQPGHSVLATPGGAAFCIVPFDGNAEAAPTIDAARPHAADQICLDVPGELFDAEVAFWSRLTGWTVNDPVSDEFRSFAQPASLPLRLLVQRLGPAKDTAEDAAHGHLDFSCGPLVDELAAKHVQAGAFEVERFDHWTVMTDPAGMAYCLTRRPSRAG